MENDFKLLRSGHPAGTATGHVPLSLLKEVERGFLEETDYLNEAKNLEFFSQGLRHYSWLAIPRVYWEHTTDRVLTMSFLEGAVIRDFLASGPSQAVRDLIGQRLFELYHFQVQRLGERACRPPTRQLPVRTGGRDRAGGLRLREAIDDQRRRSLPRLHRARLVARAGTGPTPMPGDLRGQGSVPPGAPDAGVARGIGGRSVPRAGSAGREVDFGKPKLLETLGRTMRRAVRHKLGNPEFAFTSRTELGLYSLLHELRARVDTRAIAERVARGAAEPRRT